MHGYRHTLIFVPESMVGNGLIIAATCTAGKADSKALSGTLSKAGSSRPGTAKGRPAATIRPGTGSAGLAAAALAANEGVCLQVSNKKDERARKVKKQS